MADQGSDLTIKQMLSGFSAMQYNLGLLPMQTTQPMAGAPMQIAPPPPPSMHPAQMAAQAMAEQQAMMQHTLQAAQMTRYIPPPSAPMPSVGAMTAFGAMGNPFAAASPPPPVPGFGFGGAGGGAPYREMPGMFSPMFQPAMTFPRFTPSPMRSTQISNSYVAEELGGTAGLLKGGASIAGSIAGGVLGQMLIPIPGVGAAIGSYVGEKLGGGLANMMIDPAIGDMRRARALQSATASYMRTGPMLDAVSGQGMSGSAARQVARGLYNFQYDNKMEGLGFNTADYTKITQLSAEQGLLIGANSPEQMLQKVKDLSKHLKGLMQIAGDPDVRNAIKSLGEMRDLGYRGLSMQAGAVALRSSAARMAGLSMQEMDSLAMGTAGMASRFGLVGATGYAAGLTGATLGAVSISSGAVNDIQLARAGGKSGLAALNAQAQMSALNNEYYLLAGSRVNAQGKLEADAGGYRAALAKPMDQVIREASEKMRELERNGISDWSTRKQEIKDELSQRLNSADKTLAVYNQARAHQAQMGGPGKFSLAASIAATQGMSPEDANLLAAQYTPDNMRAMAQQVRAQMSRAREQDLAAIGPTSAPGLLTRMERSLRKDVRGLGEGLTGWYRDQVDEQARFEKDEEAAKRGEHINRYSAVALTRSEAERRQVRLHLARADVRGRLDTAPGARDDEGSPAEYLVKKTLRVGTLFNIDRRRDDEGSPAEYLVKKTLRVGTMSNEDRRRDALGGVLGIRDNDQFSTLARASLDVKDLNRVSSSIERFMTAVQDTPKDATRDRIDYASALAKPGDAASGFNATAEIRRRLLKMAESGDPIADDTVREVVRSVAQAQGLTGKALEDAVNKAAPSAAREFVAHVDAYGTENQKASYAAVKSAYLKQGAERSTANVEAEEKAIAAALKGVGLKRNGAPKTAMGIPVMTGDYAAEGYDVTDETLSEMRTQYDEYREGDSVSDFGADVLAYAAAVRAESDPKATDEFKARSKVIIEQLNAKYAKDPEKLVKLQEEARQKAEGMTTETASAWAQVAGTSGSAEEASGKVKEIVKATVAKTANANFKKTQDRLGSLGGASVKGATSTLDKIKKLTEKQIKNSGLAAPVIEKLLGIKSKGTATPDEISEVEALIGEVKATEEVDGSAAGPRSQELMGLMSQYETGADKMTADERRAVAGKIEAGASLTMGEAVIKFSKAVDKMVDGTAKDGHDDANPWMQAVRNAFKS